MIAGAVNMLGATVTSAWRYRQFILSSIIHELRTRFARSRLGGLWLMLHQLAQVAVFALVLSGVFGARVGALEGPFAYALYLTAGTLAWALFAELVGRGQGLFIEHGNLLKKIAFPKICLPLILAGLALVNNMALLAVALLFFALAGHWPGWLLLWLLPLYAVVLTLGLGLGVLLGVLNVFMRDIGQTVPIVLQFWFWFTPVVYVSTLVPAEVQRWVTLNPMFHLVEGFHAVLIHGQPPALPALLAMAALAGAVLLLGLWCLYRASHEMTDVL